MTSAWKRIFSMVLVICLLLCAAPMQALALTPEDFTDNTEELAIQLREALGEYASEVTLYYKTVMLLTEEEIMEIFNLAVAKEALPNRDSAYTGDYLLLSVTDVDVESEYTVKDVHYYNKITYRMTYANSHEREMELRKQVKKMTDTMGGETRNDYQRCKRIFDYLRSDASGMTSDGKTALFYAMAISSGIDCRVIVGTADGKAHTWNMAKLYGKWYAVDVERGVFLKGSAILADHTPDVFYTSKAFLKNYPLCEADFDPATVAAGTMENGLRWRYDAAEAALVISGQGPMQDFALQTYSGVQTVVRPWTAYVAEGANYIVEEGVTSVGRYAFYGVVFESIQLPATLQTVGVGAFEASRGTEIALPEGIVEIPADAFKGSNVMRVELPASVTAIGERAFSGCMRLETLRIPAGIVSIGQNAFDGCRSLRKALFLGDEAAWKSVAVGWGNQKLLTALRSGNGGFFDVPETEWFYGPVNWAAERNITGGIGSGRFGAYDGCTRAQVVTFLWAASGRPAPKNTDNPFTDVAADAWYAKPVLWAVENGITTGVSDTEFGPDRTCTRAQIVTFLYAVAKRPAVDSENPFEDVTDGDWFKNSVLWAAKEGVTGGIAEGKFGPNDVCTRAQVATFLYKVFAGK